MTKKALISLIALPLLVMQRLRDRIGENTGQHILTLTPSLRRTGFGVNSIDVASRYDSNVTVRYSLTDAKSGKVLTRGSVLLTLMD